MAAFGIVILVVRSVIKRKIKPAKVNYSNPTLFAILSPKKLATCLLRPADFILCFKKFYLFVFRVKGRKGEREGEKHHCARDTHPLSHPELGTWPTTQECVLTGNSGNRTSNIPVHEPVFNPLSPASEDEDRSF